MDKYDNLVKIFAVYDSKVEAYMQPFFMATVGAALRAWETTVNDPNSNISKYPSDYTLFEIGAYDDKTGNVYQHAAKKSLGLALEYVRNK